MPKTIKTSIRALVPSYVEQHSQASFTKKFGLPWQGPGIYMTNNDTLLVMPVPPEVCPTNLDIWNNTQSFGTNFMVAMYYERFEHTILSVLAMAPARTDLRAMS